MAVFPSRPIADVSQSRGDCGAGRSLQPAGSEHDCEDRGHAGGHCGHGGSHLSRREHQRHRQLTLPQAIAAAEAVERGLKRREAEGLEISTMGPVCTIMVGRLDDWLKVLMEKQKLSVDPGYLEWAGVAVFKKTYKLYRERGYRLRLLSAAFRNHMHWSEFIGGDVVISPPCAWQRRFNASDIEVTPRMDKPSTPGSWRRC